MDKINEFLNYGFTYGKEGYISVGAIFLVIIAFILTSLALKFIQLGITKKMDIDDRSRFVSVFSYLRYFIYLIVFLIVISSSGVDLTALFASAAALLIGVGLALQTLFQDIFSGIFILIDHSVNVGDIIDVEGKTGRVTKINLRTTRAETIENKILIIPNHFFLTNILYNWTQNERMTRESISVGVAYGSDVQLVKSLLLQATKNSPVILQKPEPTVYFTEFADSSLNFKLVFTVNDSFQAVAPKSDLHFEVDRLFRENNVNIPFPQRDIHIISKS